jgi:hypothetical protein
MSIVVSGWRKRPLQVKRTCSATHLDFCGLNQRGLRHHHPILRRQHFDRELNTNNIRDPGSRKSTKSSSAIGSIWPAICVTHSIPMMETGAILA